MRWRCVGAADGEPFHAAELARRLAAPRRSGLHRGLARDVRGSGGLGGAVAKALAGRGGPCASRGTPCPTTTRWSHPLRSSIGTAASRATASPAPHWPFRPDDGNL